MQVGVRGGTGAGSVILASGVRVLGGAGTGVLAEQQVQVGPGAQDVQAHTSPISSSLKGRNGAMATRCRGTVSLEATQLITAERGGFVPRVLILTASGLDEYLFGALRAGATASSSGMTRIQPCGTMTADRRSSTITPKMSAIQLRAAPAWHDLAAGAAAAAPGHHHFRIGLILLTILVLGGLGFGAVRLTHRARLSRQQRAAGRPPEASSPGPQTPAPARLAAGPAPAPPRRAPVSFGSPNGGWAVETHGPVTQWRSSTTGG